MYIRYEIDGGNNTVDGRRVRKERIINLFFLKKGRR